MQIAVISESLGTDLFFAASLAPFCSSECDECWYNLVPFSRPLRFFSD